MKSLLQLSAIALASWVVALQVQAGQIDPDFPRVSYVQFESFYINTPQQKLTVGAQMRVPEGNGEDMPAVVIVHGSAGIDSRGTLYAEALNEAGIVTLEIDMWGARGISGGGQRPPLPTFTLPDAYGALNYLATTAGIDTQRIGVLGFSWGGVMSLLAADKTYTNGLGNGNQFAAHVAHYPVCWGYNYGIPGIVFNDLTGAPILIQVGDLDDYDEGGGPCEDLASSFPEVSVNVYPNAHHAWDRLQPPLTVQDPFSHLGAGGEVNIIPNPGKFNQSSKAVISAFSEAFGLGNN